MAITRTIERTVSLDAMALRESLPGLAYQGEQNAHQFIIHCTQDGSPVTLTGSVLLKFLRPDGIAVDVPGSVVDGAAVVTLSGNCYAVMGRAEITIFVTQDSATVAVYSANTAITRTTSGEEISGGDIINLPALQERFEDMADAIDDCEAAASAATAVSGTLGLPDINDRDGWGDGCFNTDGTIFEPTDADKVYKYTVDYIPVFGGETLTLKMSTDTANAKWARWVYYDADKNVVGYGVQNQTWTATITTTIEIPADAFFWRISFRSFGDNTFAISYSRESNVIQALRDYTDVAAAFETGFAYPAKWRHALIANDGTTYGSVYGAITDFLIPTALCDGVSRLNTSYEVSVAYFGAEHGRPVFDTRTVVTGSHTIDKTYPWFAVQVFGSWSTALDLSACASIAQITAAIDRSAASIFAHRPPFVQPLNTRDLWSVCHQGYDPDTLLGRSKLGGYAEAANRGYTHGECDVKLTSDGKLVCCHDNSFVDATTGNTITISSHTLAELRTYDYYGSTIATLDEIIVECRNNGLKLFIDQVDSANVSAVCDTVSEYNAWNMCTFVVGYNDSYPDLAPFIVNAIHSYNENASIAIVTYVTGYTAALQYALTLSNAIIYVGQYTGQIEVVKAIAAATSGKLRLMLWTVDFLHAYLSDALPYIDGYTSNVWSGRDVFNPTINAGL